MNTARGRRKEKNVRENPKVTVAIIDLDDPYRDLSVRGTVDSVDTTGAVEHIDALARRYFDVDEYLHHGEEDGDRVVVRIRPTASSPRNPPAFQYGFRGRAWT